MNREDVGMDLTFENMDILRKEVQATKLLLSECDEIFIEEGISNIELRGYLSGKLSADEVIELLASQQGERNQCDGCQAGIPLVDGAHRMGRPGGYPDLMRCQKERYEHPEQAEGAQGEREAFEAHESKERRLSPADQKFWFRRGAVADYDIKSIDDAWKAWKARAALAQPALQCKKCGGTGDADSGGIHPWGEAAMVPCDCAHTERARGKRTEDGDTIIDRLRLGGLTIDGDNAYKRDLLDCVVGALAFGFQGQPAPEETHWLHRFWEIGNAEREARAALAQPSPTVVRDDDLVPVPRGLLGSAMYAIRRQVEAPNTLAKLREYAYSRVQPSPAPELERPEVVGYVGCSAKMTSDGWENGPEYLVLAGEASDADKRYDVPLMTVAQHDRIVGALRAAHQITLDELHAMEVHVAQAGRNIDAAQARVAELECGTVYVEARRCSACGHGGVNDGADGLSACGHCEWTGTQPSADECPDCLRQNCMSVACPECGGRYELVAEAEITAPVAQAGQVSDDSALLDWLQENEADTIYLDDGRIVDIAGRLPVRDAIRKAMLAAAPAQGGRDE